MRVLYNNNHMRSDSQSVLSWPYNVGVFNLTDLALRLLVIPVLNCEIDENDMDKGPLFSKFLILRF